MQRLARFPAEPGRTLWHPAPSVWCTCLQSWMPPLAKVLRATACKPMATLFATQAHATLTERVQSQRGWRMLHIQPSQGLPRDATFCPAIDSHGKGSMQNDPTPGRALMHVTGPGEHSREQRVLRKESAHMLLPCCYMACHSRLVMSLTGADAPLSTSPLPLHHMLFCWPSSAGKCLQPCQACPRYVPAALHGLNY